MDNITIENKDRELALSRLIFSYIFALFSRSLPAIQFVLDAT